ncbi:PAS-domain containing protein [Georgenia sp.]
MTAPLGGAASVPSDLWVAFAGLLWLGALFAVARYGERNPRALGGAWPVVYALSLAVYCTSWTFYGTITQAVRSGWWLPPTFVGTILLYAFAAGLLMRMVRLARKSNASSVADLIASRLGHHAGLAALVTAVAVMGTVPYLALQLKAVTMSFAMFRPRGDAVVTPWHDSALYVALAMALFAMLFGTRRSSAVSHNRGLVLAMAFDSAFKLLALLVVGLVVLHPADVVSALTAKPRDASGFPALVLMGALAMFTLPHQFHIGIVECRDARHVRTARWLFPLYMVLIALPILPLAEAGRAAFAGQGVPSDLYMLALPLARGEHAVAVLAFLGGLSAAASMVVVATLALSLMIGHHWIAPLRLRAGWGQAEPHDLRPQVLRQRRVAILAVVLLAWVYSRLLAGNEALADIGALAFSALAGLAPAVLVAVYRPRVGPRAVAAGLAIGTLLWGYLLLPQLAGLDLAALGPLAPQRLFGLLDWSPLARAVTLGLLANLATIVMAQRTRWGRRWNRPRGQPLSIAQLRALAARFLPRERVLELLQDADDSAEVAPAALAAVEHELAAVIGAASARLLVETARRDRSGRLAAVAAIVDEATHDLRFNQRVLGAALENMSQGICVVDAELQVVAWNRRYAEMFAYPEGLLAVGRPIAGLIGCNLERGFAGAGMVAERLQRRIAFMREGRPHVSERRFPDASVVEVRGNPMPGGGYVATFTDVTAFREAERALIRVNETLEQRVAERTAELHQATLTAQRANAAKSRFLAAVSHDLLQPLHAAQLFAHALVERMNRTDASDLLEHLQGALASTESLLADLLDIARLDGGQLAPRLQDFPLAELLDPLVKEFGALAQERGVRLQTVAAGVWVRSDPRMLRRILQNFLANALRYSERGRVLIGCRRSADGVRVEVFDTGPGIDDDERERIFDEFRRGRDAVGQGLGLGLAIAQRMAGLLGHRLSLRSVRGRGSVFAIALPRARPASRPLQEVAAVQGLPPGAALVVDNDREALSAMRGLLQGWGWHVWAASDAAQALAIGCDPDILLLDYHLDLGTTGLQLLERLRERHAAVPALILTADREQAVRDAVREAGASILYKPMKPLALRQFLQRLHLAPRMRVRAS